MTALLVSGLFSVLAAIIFLGSVGLREKWGGGVRMRILTRLESGVAGVSSFGPGPESLRKNGGPVQQGYLAFLMRYLVDHAVFFAKWVAVIFFVAAFLVIFFDLKYVLFCLGVLVVLCVSFKYWRWRRRKVIRAEMIEASVPEAIDMMVRNLEVGRSIVASVQSVAQDMFGVLADEFKDTADKLSYGQGVVDGLRDLAERTDNQTLRFLAAAVAIQSSTGGNLAEVLARLAITARAREGVRRKIRVITAEASWSGRFLSAFPLIVVTVLLFFNPGYFDPISHTSLFVPMLVVVFVLVVVNVVYMSRLVRLDSFSA